MPTCGVTRTCANTLENRHCCGDSYQTTHVQRERIIPCTRLASTQTIYAELTASTPPTYLRSCHWLPESASKQTSLMRFETASYFHAITIGSIYHPQRRLLEVVAQCCITTTSNDQKGLSQQMCRYPLITALTDKFT